MAERDDIEELYAHRDDPDEWEEEPEDFEVRTSRSQVVSFRLPPEELEELIDAADAADESLSEYIRKAIYARLHGASGVRTSLEGEQSLHRHVHISVMELMQALDSATEGSDVRADTWTAEGIPDFIPRDLIA